VPCAQKTLQSCTEGAAHSLMVSFTATTSVHVFLAYFTRTVGAASLESHFYSGRANVPRLSLYRAQLDVESRVWECQVRIASCSKYTRPRPDSVHKDTPDQQRMDIKTPPTSPWRSGRAAWAHRRRESCSRRFDAGPQKTEIAFRGVWYKSEMPQTLPRPAQTHPWPSARAPTDRGTWGFGEGW